MDGCILVTGVTGNIGFYAAKHLVERGAKVKGATTNPDRGKDERIEYVRFDFLKEETFADALAGVDSVFLIRPPMLNDAKQLYPFIDAAKSSGVRHIVFVSLLGVEKNPFPPHYRIEKYIQASGIPYTFLRPSFFMQNLNTTHQYDIKENGDIFLPAGDAKVSFIDTRDIGEAGAIVLLDPESHKNRSYTLTGSEAVTYAEVASAMTRILNKPVRYSSPGVFAFRREMLRRGHPKAFVNVMAVLYLTTRFGMAKSVTNDLAVLLQREPTSIGQYIEDHRGFFL